MAVSEKLMLPTRGFRIWIPAIIIGGAFVVALAFIAALWTATIAVAVWTGDGVPAAWQIVVEWCRGLVIVGWWV